MQKESLRKVEVKEEAKKPEMIKFSLFFKYMTPRDKCLMYIGGLSAVLCGILLPSLAIVIGAVTDTFSPSNSSDHIKSVMGIIAGYISLVGLGTWIFGYLYFGFW